MNERTLLGIDCNGTEIYGKLDKISVYTNSDPDCGGASWGWLSGCSKYVSWSNNSGSRFTQKDADELANKWNNKMVSLNYPECRAKEVDSGKPRTVYACGSSDYAQLGGTFEKGFDCFYELRITNEKERSKWMDERMAKGYSFRYFKNEKRENIGVFCVETKEEFNYVFEGAKNTEEQVQADSRKKEENMANWGIASTAPEIEKIKAELADYLHGLNSCAEIDYSTYSQLFDFSLPLIQKAYELGKKEAQQVIQPDLYTN